MLRGAVKVAATVHSLESSAVVHCSDGWDRTPQARVVVTAERAINLTYFDTDRLVSRDYPRSLLSHIHWFPNFD